MTIMTLYSHMYMSKYFFLAYICTIWRRKAITDHIYKPPKKTFEGKKWKKCHVYFSIVVISNLYVLHYF